MEGFETWIIHVNVGIREHKIVHAELTPLQAGNGEPAAVTKTVTSTVTTTSPIIITATTTATTTISENTITVTSEVTTATTSTITSNVTEQTGLPATFSYGAIGVAIIAVIAAVIISTRKCS